MNLKRNYHYTLSLNLALTSFVVESVRWFLTSLHGNKTKITVAYNTTTTRWHHKTAALECRLQTVAGKIISTVYCVILYHISYHISYHIISYIISYHVMSCHISCHVMSCHIIYHIILNHIMPCHILYIISYHISYHIACHIVSYQFCAYEVYVNSVS